MCLTGNVEKYNVCVIFGEGMCDKTVDEMIAVWSTALSDSADRQSREA